MAAQYNLVLGTEIWVEDSDFAWVDGEVLEVTGDDITVSCTSGKTVTIKISNVYPKDVDAPCCGVDDMTKLAYLHEPGVLQNLKSRYDMDEIYTYTGSILIAVNPFRRLPHLYDTEVMAKYKGVALGDLPPHPFAIADAAYRQMRNEGISQSILVSGESGAGKTESTKMLMHYLAYMGGRASAEAGRSVEQQVLESNPVLEAFGNAKTVRNNNSSRFGKFVELQFDQRGRISGAAIRTYLLERSRVCQVSDPERNYHCFYMLCSAPEEIAKEHGGIMRFIQVSCLGASTSSPSRMLRTKAAAEESVLRAFPEATVMRPGTMIGIEDRILNRWAQFVKKWNFLPLIGDGSTRIQPVYVVDVASAIIASLKDDGSSTGKIYELGGPEVLTVHELAEIMYDMMREWPRYVNVPFPIARAMASPREFLLNKVPFPLPTPNIFNLDQINALTVDTVVSKNALTFTDLGIEPHKLKGYPVEFLTCYRKGGPSFGSTVSERMTSTDL